MSEFSIWVIESLDHFGEWTPCGNGLNTDEGWAKSQLALWVKDEPHKQFRLTKYTNETSIQSQLSTANARLEEAEKVIDLFVNLIQRWVKDTYDPNASMVALMDQTQRVMREHKSYRKGREVE